MRGWAQSGHVFWLVRARVRHRRQHVVVEPVQPGRTLRDLRPRREWRWCESESARGCAASSRTRARLLPRDLLKPRGYAAERARPVRCRGRALAEHQPAGGGCEGGCDQPLVGSPPLSLRLPPLPLPLPLATGASTSEASASWMLLATGLSSTLS